jgi:hypothetical protein
MDKTTLPRLAAVLAAFASFAATPVRAQTSTPLSPDDRVLLNAIGACRTDPTPDYCAPFRGLLEHVQKAEAAVPEAETTSRLKVIAAETSETRATAVSDTASGLGPGPTGQIVAPDRGAMMSLSATSDTKTASIALDVDLPEAEAGPVIKDGTVTSGKNTLTITAQTPVGQDADYQNVATLDGLTKATTIGLALNHFEIKWRSQASVINTEDYQRRCIEIANEFLAADPSQKKTLKSTFEPHGCNAGNLLAFVTSDDNLSASRKAAFTDTIEALRVSGAPKIESMRLFSVNGKVGYESHDYYDGTTLAKQSDNKKPWQIGVAATQVFGGGRMSATVSYNHQLTYEDGGDDGQKQILCPPSGSPNLVCINGYVGAPTLTKKDLITLDYRYLTAKGPLGFPVGINPTATYDAASGVYGFQLPIYLVVDPKKALTGGLRYNWTSDEHKSVVGIFVTSAFCVLPNYSGCNAKSDEK